MKKTIVSLLTVFCVFLHAPAGYADMGDLVDEGKIFNLDRIEKIVDKLDAVISRIRYADRGYSGFFDAVQMDEKALEILHQLDLSLIEQVTGVEEAMKKLAADLEDGDLKSIIKEITAAIEQLDDKFSERDNAVSGVI